LSSGIDEVVWDIEEHTKAKHEILQHYLGGWFNILASVSGRIVYIDGFAGPGVYKGGEDGSPVIALRTAINHMLKPNTKSDIMFLFIENDKRREIKLKEVLEKEFPTLPEKVQYEVIGADFEPTLRRIFHELDESGKKLAPTFAFIDPFGFSDFSMDLMKKLVSYDRCEVLITFMAGFVHRFLDPLREPLLDSLFGTPVWRDIRKVEGTKIPELLNLYEKQLKEVCGANFTRSFEMKGEYNQVIYYMIFATKHWLGLKLMKDSMWSVDRRGQYSFSDRIGSAQKFLMDFQDEPDWIRKAAIRVHEQFRGKTVNIVEIDKFVITETEFVFRKSILGYIEDNFKDAIVEVKVPGRLRRKGSFPDDATIQFR